eukprot:jgi/Hompol1/2094/HPOL_003560-RA
MSSVKSLVESTIAETPNVVYSKSYCPWCTKAKAILTSKGIEYTVIELDKIEEGADIQAYLLEKTKQRTVPNIFIHQQHIGGHDDLVAAVASGKLDKALAA